MLIRFGDTFGEEMRKENEKKNDVRKEKIIRIPYSYFRRGRLFQFSI